MMDSSFFSSFNLGVKIACEEVTTSSALTYLTPAEFALKAGSEAV